MSRQFIGSARLKTPIYKHPYKLCALLFALSLSGCTIEGPERLVYLKSGEVVVLRGDTLSSVAARHGVSVKDLAECNGLKPPYRLTKIAKLQLPGARASFASEPESLPSGPIILKDNEDVQWTDMGDSPAEPSFKASRPVLMADMDADSDLENSLTGTDERKADRDSGSKQSKASNGWNVTDHSKKGDLSSDRTPKSGEKTAKKNPSKPVGFCRPVSGKITQKFQKNKKGAHNAGIQFHAPKGTPVYASSDGKVMLSGKLEGDPSKVIILIEHPNDWSTCYKSIDKACVSAGQQVKQGDRIGYSSGPTCIFELRNARGSVDPEKKFNP
jgi:murein DD-endopeptidase MepM/ murein hydrolase activator NlpD